MAHPEWVLKHKAPRTEIRNFKGHYRLYEKATIWDPEKKRAKKVTVRQIGVLDKELGLIPTGMSRKGRVPKGASKLKDDAVLETNFLDDFEKIEDPRDKKNQLYTVAEIFLVTLLGLICGGEGWQDIESYGKSKIDYLRCFLSYKNGIPSDDTIRRFFRSINPDHFKEIFTKWISNIAKAANATVIAIDGKTSRRSYDKDGEMLHMLSAFATDARVVLAQEKVSGKSNEITAIPLLLDMLDVKGHIVTIDAIGCQRAIANKIVSKEGDYIFSLKGNQISLLKDVELFFNSQNDCLELTDYDKGHGRIETRKCFVSKDVEWLRKKHKQNWESIQSIIKIDSTREVTKKAEKVVTEETRYYISSLKDTAPEIALKAIRDHWQIENTLHWTLDMSFNEDYSRIRKGNAPHVMAMLRHMALNILQQAKLRDPEKFKRQSIKGMRKSCSWDNQVLTDIIAKHDCQEKIS